MKINPIQHNPTHSAPNHACVGCAERGPRPRIDAGRRKCRKRGKTKNRSHSAWRCVHAGVAARIFGGVRPNFGHCPSQGNRGFNNLGPIAQNRIQISGDKAEVYLLINGYITTISERVQMLCVRLSSLFWVARLFNAMLCKQLLHQTLDRNLN